MTRFQSHTSRVSITLEAEGVEIGCCHTHIYYDRTQINRWLWENDGDTLRAECPEVTSARSAKSVIALNLPGPWGVIASLIVNREHRSQGHGSLLLMKSLDFLKECKSILLICDAYEENGFDLSMWYARHGFAPASQDFMILRNWDRQSGSSGPTRLGDLPVR